VARPVGNRVRRPKPVEPVSDIPTADAINPDEDACLVGWGSVDILHMELDKSSLQNPSGVEGVRGRPPTDGAGHPPLTNKAFEKRLHPGGVGGLGRQVRSQSKRQPGGHGHASDHGIPAGHVIAARAPSPHPRGRGVPSDNVAFIARYLADVDDALAHKHARPADPSGHDDAGSFLGADLQYTWTAHLHPLRDAPGESAVRRPIVAEHSG
jgi:hypothetical protein